MNFFDASCIAAEDDDATVPVAEGWLVREESPLENNWMNMVGDPQDRTPVHAHGKNNMASHKSDRPASCPIAGH